MLPSCSRHSQIGLCGKLTASVFHFRKSEKEISCFSSNVCLIFSSISLVLRLSSPALFLSNFLSWATDTRSFPSFKDWYSCCNLLPTWKVQTLRSCWLQRKNSPQRTFVVSFAWDPPPWSSPAPSLYWVTASEPCAFSEGFWYSVSFELSYSQQLAPTARLLSNRGDLFEWISVINDSFLSTMKQVSQTSSDF